jgi:hypothetical protein
MNHGHEAGMAAKMPCASSGKSCAQQGDVSVDGRGGQAKSPDSLQAVVGAAPCLSNFDLTPTRHANPPAAPPPVGASPPLNVLYCVYRK